MTNFIYDGVALPADKVDGDGAANPLTNPTRQCGSNDINRVFQALRDIRSAIRIDGAIGDGVTNNTAVIQAAITANPGRKLGLSAGKYVVSSTLLIANRSTSLVGDFGNRSVDNGTEIIYTGVGPCIQIGVDNGHAWNVGDYNGPQDHQLENLWISHGAPDTALVSAGDAVLRYKAGAYGVWDWRGGGITMRNVGIEKFEANFVGIESDINTFDVITSLYSKYGFYFGPRTDQQSIRSFLSFFCDRAITVDGARQVRIRDAQIVGCGTSTTSGIEVRRGSGGVWIDRPWLEHLQGYQGVDQASFVSAGEVDGYGVGGSIQAPGGAPNTLAVEGVAVNYPLAYTTAAAAACHTKYIASLGKCHRFELNSPTIPPGISLSNFDALIAVPAAQAPTNADTQVLVTGVSSSTPAAQIFSNLGAGNPVSAIWTSGINGTVITDEVTFTKDVKLTGEIAPAAISANSNNYFPTGLDNSAVLLISSTAPFNVTGLATGTAGRVLWVYNIGANSITLTHQDALSTAANRIIGRGNANVVLLAGTGVQLYWSASQSRWIAMDNP